MNLSDITGVLVTYRPQAEALAERLRVHRQQLSRLVVVHNGCDGAPETDAALADLAADDDGLRLLHQAENNLAHAQNAGIRAALADGAQAVLLLDDDSEMAPDMPAALLRAWEPGIGLLAARMIERAAEHDSRHAIPFARVLFRLASPDRHDVIDGAFTPIASGSLIPAAVLERVGLMDESLGIDYVDREFCLRLLVRGYTTRIVSNAMLYHRLGHGHSVAGGRITCHNHPPARRYTIFRNRLRCWARYGTALPGFVLYDALALCYDLFRILALETDKRAKLHAALAGALDALSNPEPPQR